MHAIKGISLFLLLLTQTSFNSHFISAENCFPENDILIPVFDNKTAPAEQTGITEEEFNAVLDEAQQIMGPVIEERGATLVIERLWSDPKVNAAALQQGSRWTIKMYGGLARHEITTIDSFRSVVCHELGHHLAGSPTVPGFFRSWASNEGQSDYYATYQCMKKIIIDGQAAGLEVKGTDQSLYVAEEINFLNEQCSSIYGSDDEQMVNICRRIALGGLSGARLLEFLGANREGQEREPNHISFLTPNPNIVDKTNEKHPEAQCRADSYLAGALCNLDYNTPLDSSDPNIGTCNRDDGFKNGLRPLCWFKPGDQGGGGGGFPFPFPFSS